MVEKEAAVMCPSRNTDGRQSASTTGNEVIQRRLENKPRFMWIQQEFV